MLGNLDINDCNQDLQELIRSTTGGVGFLKNTLTLTANSATAILGFVYNTSTDALLVFQNGKYLEKDQYKVSSDGGYITPISGNWIASSGSPLVFNFILLKAIPLNMVSIDGSLIADGTIDFSKVNSNFMSKMIKEFEDNYHMDATIIENGTIDITKLTQRIQDDITAFENHILYTNAGHVPYGVASMPSQNVYTVSVIPKPSAYYDGMPVSVKIQNNATGASTINIDGLGARGIKKATGADVKNFKKDGIYTLRYNSNTANFILQGEGGSGDAKPSDLRSGKTASTDDGDIVGTAPEQPATTYIVGTSDQVIASGKILSGNQVIKGYPDLIPDNIAEGKKIGNVTGIIPTNNGIGGSIISGIPYLNIGEKIRNVVSVNNNDIIYYNTAGVKRKFDYVTKTYTTITEDPVTINGYVALGTKIYKDGVQVFDTQAHDDYGVYLVTDNYTYYKGNTTYSFIDNYLPPDEIKNRVYFSRLYVDHNNHSKYSDIYFTIYYIDLSISPLVEREVLKVPIPHSNGNVWGWGTPGFIYKGICYYNYSVKSGDDYPTYTHQLYLPTISTLGFADTNHTFGTSYLNRLQKVLIYYNYTYYIYEPQKDKYFRPYDDDSGVISQFPSRFGDAGFNNIDIPLYGNNDTSVIPLGGVDVFKIKDFSFRTSIGENYLGFTKNFIICASGNLYLYN